MSAGTALGKQECKCGQRKGMRRGLKETDTDVEGCGESPSKQWG